MMQLFRYCILMQLFFSIPEAHVQIRGLVVVKRGQHGLIHELGFIFPKIIVCLSHTE